MVPRVAQVPEGVRFHPGREKTRLERSGFFGMTEECYFFEAFAGALAAAFLRRLMVASYMTGVPIMMEA